MSDTFAALWTVARKAPLSMGFPRQEHWSGLPDPSPGDLPNPGFESKSPALQIDSFPSEPPVQMKNRYCSFNVLQLSGSMI